MQWENLINGALGSSPMALVLGFAVHRLWAALRERDAEIARLNEARIQDLLSVSRHSGGE